LEKIRNEKKGNAKKRKNIKEKSENLIFISPGFSSQLTKLPTTLEKHAKNLRTTLERIARAQGLDPLSPSTWYNTSPKEIIAKTQVFSAIHLQSIYRIL
jgi:hypothetical protein